jgi:hypothetical protein
MNAPPGERAGPLLEVVGPADDWVLERLARRLAAKLPYAEFVPWRPRPGGAARIAYYVNYALYEGPSGLIDVAFFTHYDEAQRFLERARRVDHCVCMSGQYADWLLAQGVRSVTHIPMGFDYYRYRPQLVLGVFGRLEHPRKGKHLVEKLRQLPFVDIVATEGRVPEKDLRDLYQGVDYVLIPATVEGGPMCLLEGLAMGKPVIAPADVGMVPEFGNTEHILRYPAGDAETLVRVATACHQEKLRRTRLVQDRTWDRWAEAHHRLFTALLKARGLAVPEPAPGFRFGLLAELEIPAHVDVEHLEARVDRAAGHLFYGRYRAARAALMAVAAQFPCAHKLLATVPADEPGAPEGAPLPETSLLRPLR